MQKPRRTCRCDPRSNTSKLCDVFPGREAETQGCPAFCLWWRHGHLETQTIAGVLLYQLLRWCLQVALRMKARGRRDGTRAGNVVQYIICTDKQAEPGANMGLAARAYHPSELQENSNLAVDTHYYLSQQLHPVVARMCAPLEMTSDARLAEYLGLDPSKFKKSMPVSEKLANVRSCQPLYMHGKPVYARKTTTAQKSWAHCLVW